MSLDILTKTSQEVVGEKKGIITESKKEGEKKEGFSLFDSMLKDIQSDTSESKTSSLQNPKEQKNLEQKVQNPTEKIKVELKNTTIFDGEVEKNSSRKVADKLVDLMVDSVKEKNTKSVKVTNSEIGSKTSIQEKVEVKTTLIKEAVEEIKEEIKNHLASTKEIKETKEVKEVKSQNVVQVEVKTLTKEEKSNIQEKVEVKTTLIKEAVEEIKEEVKNLKELKSENVIKTDSKKIDKTESKTSIQEKVEVKTTLIKEAVEEIKEEVKNLLTSTKEIKENIKQENLVKNDSKKETVPTTQEIIETKIQFIKDTTDEIKVDVEKIIISSKLPTDDINTKQKNSLHEQIQTLTKETISNLNTPQVDGKTSLLANGFLNLQQQTKQTVSLTQVVEAKKNIENNQTLQSVKESASMLDLKPEKIEVAHSKESEKTSEQKLDLADKRNKESQLMMMQNNRGLSRFIVDKNNVEKNSEVKLFNDAIQKNATETVEQKEKSVVLNVPQNVVETIQNKIIGAQQKMGSFMSEVARNMYLNYKPPFTAIRMNLNPENLGTIAIVMRASKTDNNNVTVSMNISSNSTMEAFAENKAALQNALQRQLGESSNVTLNFDMQDNQSNSQFNQSNQNNDSSRFQGQSSGNSSEESQNILLEEEETEELNYM